MLFPAITAELAPLAVLSLPVTNDDSPEITLLTPPTLAEPEIVLVPINLNEPVILTEPVISVSPNTICPVELSIM